MKEYVCRKGRIYGLEKCDGEVYHDPDFLPQCSCGETCKHDSISNRVSEKVLEVSMS